MSVYVRMSETHKSKRGPAVDPAELREVTITYDRGTVRVWYLPITRLKRKKAQEAAALAYMRDYPNQKGPDGKSLGGWYPHIFEQELFKGTVKRWEPLTPEGNVDPSVALPLPSMAYEVADDESDFMDKVIDAVGIRAVQDRLQKAAEAEEVLKAKNLVVGQEQPQIKP